MRRRSWPREGLENSVSGPGAANVKVPAQRGAGCVHSGTEGLCSQNAVAHGKEIREEAGGNAEPGPGGVLCAVVTDFNFILTVMKTHWRVLSRGLL